MNRFSALLRLSLRFLCLLLAAFCLTPSAFAGQASPTPAPQAKARAASEALQEVDALLKQVSEITGLPIRHPVKSAIVSREEINRFVRQRLKEEYPQQELRAQELALKQFGLLPPDFELETFLVRLLTEQAAGYYDQRRKQFYIADWTPLAIQRPAMIHELTHALQDQHVGLERFLPKADVNQDEQMARVAVLEGSGMVAMMEYVLSLRNPQEILRLAGSADLTQFPVFTAAPLYVRESLLFPYTGGMQYMRWLLNKQGKSGYLAALKNPPRSTAEVLHPGREPVNFDNLRPPEVSPLPAGYALLDSDVLGELDVRILLQQYAGEKIARQLAPAWRGFRYALYEHQSRSSAFLVHRSRWKDAEAAAAFADAYRKVLAAKGEKNAQVQVEADTVAVHEGLMVFTK